VVWCLLVPALAALCIVYGVASCAPNDIIVGSCDICISIGVTLTVTFILVIAICGAFS
jgi:hypothetical protein